MGKKLEKFLVLCGIVFCIIFSIPITLLAADILSASPNAKIEYNHSATVNTGTIRYVQQNAGAYWNSNYWSPYGSNTSSGECYSACVSMALSYVGVNHTAGEIVSGGRKWAQSGASVEQVSSVSSAVDRYINGRGKYSPIVIWIPYTSGNHWVLVAGRVSGNTYLIVDPWNGSHGSTWQATINGDTISYWGGTQSIGTKLQYYNASSPDIKPQPIGNNPFGYLDHVTAEAGKITVYGWAADMDAPNDPIDVHFYTVQNGEKIWLGATTASLYHAGISNSYPALNNYHGYDATFDTGLSGDIQVEAYGINVGSSGSNVMLWDSPKTVSVPKDTISPTISNVIISNISSSGYTVTCDVSDNIGLSSVQFPTWSYTNGQDDLVWHEGKISGNKATCKINVSDHKGYVNCTYQTDIYAYDKAGNCKTYINGLFTYIDATPPTISDVEVVDVSEGGYTVKCKVTDNHSKIDRVQFPTWFEEDNPFNADWSWGTSATYSGKLEDGKYVFRVNTSKYKNQTGKYHTHIYAWDEYGNQSEGYATETIITKAHKHDYTSSIKKPATCTESGIRLYTCKDNDDSYEETIPATGHQHTELRNVKAATCAQEGYTGDTYCKDCNTKLSSGKSITKKEHTWDSGKITTAATCSGKGIKTYTCTGCQATKTEEIAATGHRNTEYRNAKEATCAEAGYTGDLYCKDCNTKLRNGSAIARKSHTWDTGVITTTATCTGKGIRTYTCTNCKTTKTEELPAMGHQHTEVRNVKAATCAQEGYTGDTYCKDCEAKLSSGQKTNKTEHQWNSGKVTKNASCTEAGTRTYTCIVCESTRIEELPATGHQVKVTKFAKEASCKTEGYTGDIYCQDCGKLLQEGVAIPKLAHTWNTGVITKAATCTEAGVRTFTCAVCGTTRTETVSATGHGALEIRGRREASCAAEGYTGDTYCTVCGRKTATGSSIAMTGHSWNGGAVTKQPTTTETGVRTFTCQKCGATRTEAIAKLEVPRATPGSVVKDKATNGVYRVLQDGLSVQFMKPITKKKASVKIPERIQVNGISCAVTEIAANAFKGNTSLKSVSIGKNVTIIGTNAFYGCKKLSKVSGGTGIAKIRDKAFYNCVSLTSITIPGTVRSIGKQAFCKCKKLKNITVRTNTLTSIDIGAKAFSGTYKKPKVKVPAKLMKEYKKLFKLKGMSAKAVYKK